MDYWLKTNKKYDKILVVVSAVLVIFLIITIFWGEPLSTIFGILTFKPLTVVGGCLCSDYPDESGCRVGSTATVYCPSYLRGGCVVVLYTSAWGFIQEKQIPPGSSTVVSYPAFCWESYWCNRAICSDPDGGVNIYVRTTVTESCSGLSCTDMCIGAARIEECFCYYNEPASATYDCPSGYTCSNGACEELPTCDGTDTSCGGWPLCVNCNALDSCYAYGNGCEYRNYGCVNNVLGCGYTYSNRHTDSWVNIGSSYACCDGNNRCTCQGQEYRNYYCSGTSCIYSVTSSQIIKSGCVACGSCQYCSGGACYNYCSGTDTSCGCTSCINCNTQGTGAGRTGDGCLGNTYINYYCSGTSCVYTSDDCSDCSCSCGGYSVDESVANNNCDDGIDNDCDGLTDLADPGCYVSPIIQFTLEVWEVLRHLTVVV